ncbi:predicted protein [Coccidioides posadasii str. Silveira]|uniref:Predicted protein n=2 Tax=Coccidioides posadasii TaxID=199306 RepID=E9DE20_COCPS|nr:predicted protein [Coccidioides posadasii str. Silveira]KMM70336.1 hypothetical protein CPAG_06648 [Coccidioides posadasii RMSCC 3488]
MALKLAIATLCVITELATMKFVLIASLLDSLLRLRTNHPTYRRRRISVVGRLVTCHHMIARPVSTGKEQSSICTTGPTLIFSRHLGSGHNTLGDSQYEGHF